MRQLIQSTQVTVYVRGTRYAITPRAVGPSRTITPYEVHAIDARGYRRRVMDLSAELDKAEEFYIRCIASALREGVEFAKNPPQGDEGDDSSAGDAHQGDDEGDDDAEHEAALSAAVAAVGASIGATLHPRAHTDPKLCQHPRAFPVLSQESECCPDCGAMEALGSL